MVNANFGIIGLIKDLEEEERKKRKDNFRKFINNKCKKRGKRK